MFRKISYTILAFAFLIGSYSIAAVDPEITPSASASAGECEATASASLSIDSQDLVDSTTSWEGTGIAAAAVNNLFSPDEIDVDPDNREPGRIWLKVEVTTIVAADINISPSESTTTAAKGSGEVEVGIPKIGGSAGGEVSQSTTETTGTHIRFEAGLEKKRKTTYKSRSAKVTGEKYHGKSSAATASFGGLSTSDCATYRPSIFTFYDPRNYF